MAVTAYERPTTLEEAFACLGSRDATLIGGGTKVNSGGGFDPTVIVDLQALGLGGIEAAAEGFLDIGATATLQQVSDDIRVPEIVREAARREQPSTLRRMATVGGCVATGDPESELLATLLVHDAVVNVADPAGWSRVELRALLAALPLRAGRILTAVTIETTGTSSVARVGRTPADRPIVSAAARRTLDGERRLALTGVAATPVLVTSVHALDPPGDFRGSPGYRRQLAATLSARALEAVT